jgi:cytochrome b pre-mRNA-processing protein 3
MKVKHLFKRKANHAATLYAAIVAAARRKKLYSEMAVPDTMEGRLEMIILHIALLLQRLKSERVNDLPQQLIEAFFADVEANFRELGASDQAVSKKIRQVEEMYSGRMKAYDAAGSPEELQDALRRNIIGANAAVLAEYCWAEKQRLDAVPVEILMRGEVA